MNSSTHLREAQHQVFLCMSTKLCDVIRPLLNHTPLCWIANSFQLGFRFCLVWVWVFFVVFVCLGLVCLLLLVCCCCGWMGGFCLVCFVFKEQLGNVFAKASLLAAVLPVPQPQVQPHSELTILGVVQVLSVTQSWRLYLVNWQFQYHYFPVQ